jgi:mannonate dehydratase
MCLFDPLAVAAETTARTGPPRSADYVIGPSLSKEAGMGKRVMADGQMGTRLTPTPTASPHYHTITTFTWEPDGVWSTQEATTRGGGQTRSADAALLAEHASVEEGRRRYGREYSETELWTNLEFFLGKVLPVAEQVGVRLSLHPNDPPVHSIACVPCLITSKAAYDRAFALANHSPMLGMEFCVGCWLEGGQLTDASDYHPGFGDIVSAIAEFVEKINIVHFRNISQPLPKFDETFLDDGYGDMYCIMRALVAAGYTGSIILDHTPSFVPGAGGHAGASSYAIGFIKGALRAAQFELARCARL